MDRDGVYIPVEVIAPDLIQQTPVREYLPYLGDKEPEPQRTIPSDSAAFKAARSTVSGERPAAAAEKIGPFLCQPLSC